MWDGVIVFPTETVKTGGLCGILLFPGLRPLVSGARKRPIASTGRQGNCCSACRASTECAAAQLRNAVCQPDTHSEAAAASMASGQAKVCGHACLWDEYKNIRQDDPAGCLISVFAAYVVFQTLSFSLRHCTPFLSDPLFQK